MTSRTFIAACLAAACLLCSCEAGTRYRVLSFLFDGVPPPPEQNAAEGSRQGRSEQGRGEKRGYRSHGPYAARLCEGCHQRRTNALIMPIEELCLHCHEFKARAKYIHGPLAAGGCVVCHDPHGSGNGYLLVSAAEEFCLYCHDRNDVMRQAAHQGLDRSCTSCHNAHMSDAPFLLH